LTAAAPCGPAVSATTPKKLVTLGRVSGLYGVKGWVKVQSYTEPRENIATFPVWTVTRNGVAAELAVEHARAHGSAVVAKLRGIEDRDEARAWLGSEIAVDRSLLPPCAPGEYYWADLEGLEVRTPDGLVLGSVDHLLATGGNDVLVLTGERERLIPFVPDAVIRSVDLEAGVIVADWSPED
jgi:16S rRNA processing protein RimM